jgi:hypothetical protein
MSDLGPAAADASATGHDAARVYQEHMRWIVAAAVILGVALLVMRPKPHPVAVDAPRHPMVAPAVPPVVSELPAELDAVALRARLPDNRYWTAGPESARQSRALHGKILEGTASDDEIETYFDERRRLLADYAELARVVLDENALSERDRGLFELALRLDQARLDSLPRERADAIARKALQEERRAAWRR